MDPKVRTGLTHAGSALGGFVAAVGFISSHGIDMYAIWDQLNTVVADVTKLSALVTAFGTGIYGIYKSTTKSTLGDLAKDPEVRGIVVSPDMAAAIPSVKVQATVAELPAEAKIPAPVAQKPQTPPAAS